MIACKRPPLRYPGGKWRLAPWIISLFPSHMTYVEPFGGGGSVLLRKPAVELEVYSDLDPIVTRYFEVLRCSVFNEQLIAKLEATPYDKPSFLGAMAVDLGRVTDPLEQAYYLVIRGAMGFSTYAVCAKTGFRPHPDAAAAYHKGFGHLRAINRRLQSVVIENRDALAVMADYDSPTTLFYLDPPYVQSTRKTRPDQGYRYELSNDYHRQLFDFISGCRAKVVLSGYYCDWYDTLARQWGMKAHTKAVTTQGVSSHVPRTEYIWIKE